MNSLILSKATFYRNIKDYKFSHKLTSEQKQEITNKLLEILGEDYSLIVLSNASENVINYINQNSLINKNSTVIILNKTQPICLDLFNGEHVSIVATGEDCFNQAKKVADILQNKIALAYLDDYGYLMSNLNNVGAGIKLECDMCLDAICGLGKIEQVQKNINMLGFALTQTNIKSYFKIATKCSLGFSEPEICENFNKTMLKLQDLEEESVRMLNVSSGDEILDNVSRSVAILNSAHLMNIEELTRHLIILRTGLNLGYEEIDLNKINKLQKLVINKLNFVSKDECKELAKTIKSILKGESNV